MKVIYKYYKNSNTGEIIMKQIFSETNIKIPEYYYNWNRREINKPDLTGFVEISREKFDKEGK